MSRGSSRFGFLNPRNRIEQEERRNGGKPKQRVRALGFSRRRLSLRSSVPLVQSFFSASYLDRKTSVGIRLNPRNRIEQEERRNGGKPKQRVRALCFSRRRLSLRSSVPLVQSFFSPSCVECS
jgi:hypothetical protein